MNDLTDPVIRGSKGQTGGASLVCRSIGKAYLRPKSVPLIALEDVNLRIDDGEFVSIVGPSGCGKSTLLNIMAGLDDASTGTVEITAGPNSQVLSDAANPPTTGYAFQRDTVLPWATVQKNVEMGVLALGLSRREQEHRVRTWLDAVGLADFGSAHPSQLSGGMRKRVALATAFAHDPSVLFMDEPFGALDAQTRLRLQELVIQLCAAKKRTVVFVTHDIDEAILLSDRILVMSARPGRILAEYRVSIPRPRRIEEVRVDPEFLALATQLWADLKVETDEDVTS